ncbi:carbohydrate-binding domain-containing protein [Dysgonomonas sp. GY75]|nr:carbohydrate-binding domain-containing protein [Dysgonomonas sp. GY75]
MLFVGCSNDNDWLEDEDEGNTEVPDIVIVDTGNEDDYVENSTFDNTVYITFSTNNAVIENSTEGVEIVRSAAGITVTSTVKGVEYIVSGTTSNGFLKIYSDYKFKLVLDGASITNTSGPAINIQSGKRCFVVLNQGTTSTLTDGSNYSTAPNDEDQKGCFFSEGELIFSGTGSLTVRGSYKHGICSDDYVRIREGRITVDGTIKDGIHTNDAFIMDNGTLSITSSSDGIECENGYIYINGGSMILNPGDDGIAASFEGTGTSVNPTVYISGGNITVNTTAQKGQGIKSTGDVSISGTGTYTIKTTGIAAKGIKTGGNVVVSGGTTFITTSGAAYYDSTEKDTSSSSGIKTGGDFGMSSGILTIKSTGAGGKGINTDGSFIMDDGTLSVTTTGTKYTYSSSQTSSPKAIKVNSHATINGGTTTVLSTYHEGIESQRQITINGGTVDVTAYDDAINVSLTSGNITINGGSAYALGAYNNSSSKPGDGIDSNGTITVTGGVVIAAGGKLPEEGFDCDNNQFKITGGVLIGTGGSTSTPTSSACTQRSIIFNGVSGTQNQYIQLRDPGDNEVLTYKLPGTISSMCILLSAPGISSTGTYTLAKGSSAVSDGTEIFKGYYTGATYSGGSATTVSVSSMVTGSGSSSGGGGGRP